MSAADATSATLPSQVAEVANVLLVADRDDSRAREGCLELLTSTPPVRSDVLCVTATGTPDEAVEAWKEHAGEHRPARFGFIDIGGQTRSAASAAGNPDEPLSILPVEHPGDLVGIEITRSRYQSAWADDGNQLVVCVDSLNSIVEHVSLERAFRFLNELTERFRAADAIAHYHIDPSPVEDRTINTLKGLFDAVAEHRHGDGWRVQVR